MRTDQMQAFSQIALAGFESDMVAHCRRLAPRRCESIGDGPLRSAIRGSVAGAACHGWTSRGAVRLYIELTLLFGSDFETDPQYPWIADILADSAAESQDECAAQVFELTRQHLLRVHGPDDGHKRAALLRLAALAAHLPEVHADGFVPAMLGELQQAHPEKARQVGAPALEALVRHAVAQSHAHGVGTPRSAALLALLMFAFGHGCLEDPLHPWIRQQLVDDPAVEAAVRLGRLQEEAAAWLEQSASESLSPAST